MLIPHVPKKPDLALRHKHGHTKRMYRRISKPLIVEPSASIQPLEVLLIGFTTEEAQIADFEIREELTVVVVAAVERVKQPVQIRLRVN